MREIALDAIAVRPDARALDAAAVAGLADSIAEVGLINPIRVRSVGTGYELVAGAHRLEACRRLGLADIAAVVVEDDDLHAELAMLDENLCRAELSPADRAAYTARRKEIYLELHPETVQHVAGGLARQNSASANLAPAFADATAKATGTSARAVQRDAERGEKVISEVLEMIRGTKLDTGAYLDKIKGLPPNEQVAAARRDLREPRPSRPPRLSSPPLAPDPLNEAEASEKQVAALMNAWNKAGSVARQEFLIRIDQPVMDAGRFGT